MKGCTAGLEKLYWEFSDLARSHAVFRVSKFPQTVSVLHPPLWQTWLSHQTCLNRSVTCSCTGKSQPSSSSCTGVWPVPVKAAGICTPHCSCALAREAETHQKFCAKRDHEGEERRVMVCRGEVHNFQGQGPKIQRKNEK